MRTFSLGGFAEFLTRELGPNVEHAKEDALEIACQIVEDEAKRVIGTYDYNWPPLADSTKKDRVRKGFSEDEPLLRTGELRDSIEHTVVEDGRRGYVGSNDDVAVFQELGTRSIPPRSFVAEAAIRKEPEIREICGALVAGAAMGEDFELTPPTIILAKGPK